MTETILQNKQKHYHGLYTNTLLCHIFYVQLHMQWKPGSLLEIFIYFFRHIFSGVSDISALDANSLLVTVDVLKK